MIFIIAVCFLGSVKHCLRDVHCVDPQGRGKETFYSFISRHQVCNYLCLLVCMELGGPLVFRQINLNTRCEAYSQSRRSSSAVEMI